MVAGPIEIQPAQLHERYRSESSALGFRSMHDVLAELYPPLGLAVTAGDLTLRLLRDSDLPAYAELISSRLFADKDAPYVFAWWDRDPEARRLDSLQFVWTQRARIRPEEWKLQFGVFEGDRLVGFQDLDARDFENRRVVSSGSYLRLDVQGRGIGTLMRQMILVLAFDHLGALRAESSAGVDNKASLAVSRHCGYRLDGTQVEMNGAQRIELQRVAVTPREFVRPTATVVVSGLTPDLCRQLAVETA
ncbi:MAG: GNAT family protein [Micropruina sp.]|uniref:GNAT family N-acetyltransferase n=1 Tax=Micropruina sp. TaxID=2737536 RepID=UPI0039E6BA6F